MRVLVTTIGTGGHIYPALEVARHLTRQGSTITLLLRSGVIEHKTVENLPYEKFSIPAAGFAGKSLVGKVSFAWRLVRAVVRLNTFMRTNLINALFGTGGFGMVPAILVAVWRRIPFYLLEMNRRPGLVTRLLGRFARLIFLALPLEIPLRGQTRVIGVPIRPDFYATPYRPAPKRIVILGGSQGAKRLNEITLGLAAARPGLKLRVITGMRDFHWVSEQLGARPVEVIGFTDHPWSYLQDATLAISRSGSNTVYELMTIGIPMILVPFPYATLDHQLANARYLEEKGAALVIEENQLSAAMLGQTIDRLLENASILNRMRRCAGQIVIRDSAQHIATVILNSPAGGANAR